MIDSKLEFASPGEIRLRGYGGEMIDFTLNNQLLDSDTWALLVDQFRRREDGKNGGWRGEYWGKMMRGASLTYRATKNEKLYSVLVGTVKDMLTVQDSLGRFSTYTRDREFTSWDMWARKYVILGMAYFTDICKSRTLKERIVRALVRHADYILAHVGEGDGKIEILDTSAHVGAMNSASILEAFVRMYTRTEDKKYLDFAEYIISTGMCKGADLVGLCLEKKLYPYQFPVTKAYEMMSCFEGLLEYYKLTGNPKHIEAVESFVDMLTKTDITLIGCAGCRHEFLDNAAKTQTEPATDVVMQETCVTVTYIKLCAKLLCLTGKARYAEYIEHSGLNALYGAVNNERQSMHRTVARTWLEGGRMVVIEDHESFTFDSYSPLYRDRRGLRCGGVQLIDKNRIYGCCVCIGSAGTAIMGLVPVMKTADGISVNMYTDCRFKTDSQADGIRLRMSADAYKSSGARISIDGGGEHLVLRLRIPGWAENFKVLLNGESVESKQSDGYLLIERKWEHDRIDVRFRAPVRMRVINGKIAFTKGPITLANDTRLGDLNSRLDIRVSDGKIVRSRRLRDIGFDTNLALAIKTREGELPLCDYAQAGKNYDDESTGLSVWMDVKHGK